MAARYNDKERGRPPKVGPDPQEQEALADAAQALQAFMAYGGAQRDAETLACVAISGWIVSRSRQVVAGRLRESPMLQLGDSKLRGWLEGALPNIAASLEHLPADAPLFELSKQQIVDVLIAGIEGAKAAMVAAGEASAFPFDDAIPFGEAA